MLVMVSFTNGDPHAQHLVQEGARTLKGSPPYIILLPHTGFSYGSVGCHIMVSMRN